MTEYKATWMLRIGVLILLTPVIVLGVLALYHGKEFSILWILLPTIPLAIIITVWVYYGSIKIKLNESNLTKETIIGKTVVEFNDDLQVFLDVRTPLGDLANVLVKSSVKSIVSKLGSEAKLHINIVVKNRENKITLDSNIKDIARLRDELTDVLLEKIYPDLVTDYEVGKIVSFGPISIQNGTLNVGNKKMDTENISDFKTKNRKLVVGSKDKLFSFAKIPTAKIPNMVCLISLAST